MRLLIEGLRQQDPLQGQTVLITGGGGGIAREAGRGVAAELGEAFPGQVRYHPLDLTDSGSIAALADFLARECGGADAVLHNATVTPLDSVEALPLEAWDQSYLVHLRGPIELTKRLLPGMRQKGAGAVVFHPSSGAVPFMGGYEVFKTAQAELAATLAGELEDSGVSVYAIGPGFVLTDTARAAVGRMAPMMGITVEEFYRMNRENTVTAEEAGVAFAVSLLFARRYHGQEIGGVQALMDAGLAGGRGGRKRCPVAAGAGAAGGSGGNLRRAISRLAGAQPFRAPVDAARFQKAGGTPRRRGGGPAPPLL